MEDRTSRLAEARELHRQAIVIDGHADTPQRFLDEGWAFSGELGTGMLSLDGARQGGLAAGFFAAWVEPVEWRGHYAERTLALLDAVHEQVRRHPAELALCTSPAEIVAAHRDGRFAVLLAVEGGHAIENDLRLLRTFYERGARYMTLTWSNSNEWADSSGDEWDTTLERHHGLTVFGRDVVREMNRLGMMIDVSHASNETLSEVLEVSRAPIIASHSSARALTDSPRNLCDLALQGIAAEGGLIMVNFFPAFIDATWRKAWNWQRSEREAAHALLKGRWSAPGRPIPFAESNGIDRAFAARLPRPPLSALIDHIDHVAHVAGIDHVGLGSDFDGIPALPEGIDSAADLPKITAALMERGYDADALTKILGGNLLRVLAEVQAAAG